MAHTARRSCFVRIGCIAVVRFDEEERVDEHDGTEPAIVFKIFVGFRVIHRVRGLNDAGFHLASRGHHGAMRNAHFVVGVDDVFDGGVQDF